MVIELLLAAFGGMAAELLAVSAEIKQRRRIIASRRRSALFVTLPLDGAMSMLVVLAYIATDSSSVNPLIALQLGASTPLLLQRFAAAIGPLSPLDVSDDPAASPGERGPQRRTVLEQLRRHFAISE